MTHTHTWREQDGHLLHDIVCYWAGLRICTCGLLHYLAPREDALELFPNFARHVLAQGHTVEMILQSLARDKADREEGSEPARHASEKADPSLCGYVSSGAEAVEAIRADAEEVMGSLAMGVAALNREEGKQDAKV